jgi:hypothetical protein
VLESNQNSRKRREQSYSSRTEQKAFRIGCIVYKASWKKATRHEKKIRVIAVDQAPKRSSVFYMLLHGWFPRKKIATNSFVFWSLPNYSRRPGKKRLFGQIKAAPA